ncbi:MAG TPA: SLC13 family permease [bacterium]|nr:SLC13 family permease [bacterium]
MQSRERRGLTTPSAGGPSVRRIAGLVGSPLLAAAVLLSPAPEGLDPAAWRTAAVAVLMAGLWTSEAVPLPAAALLPLALFPVLDVSSISETAAPYANPVIFLFLGGFLLGRALEKWGLHRRIALAIVGRVGLRPARLVWGFMLATAFLSLWVSNTATVAMMLPIGVSVARLADVDGEPCGTAFSTCLLLGIAYAASIGGMGTLVGTPPNALLAGFVSETFDVEIGFGQWMRVGIPVAAVLLPAAWWLMTRVLFPLRGDELTAGGPLLEQARADLGPAGRGERIVGTVFVLTATAWVLRPQLGELVPGLSDAGIAVAAGVLLFLIPVDVRRGEHALDWKTAAGLPWDVLLLFGGGLSLAAAIDSSGLAGWIGGSLAALGALPTPMLLAAVVLLMIFLTEITSNTASTAAFLPVIASVAVAIGRDPIQFAVPMVLAASCAFMLPVATPPNAIVYSSGRVGADRMARVGLVLNLVFAAFLTLLAWLFVPLVFDVTAGAAAAASVSPG